MKQIVISHKLTSRETDSFELYLKEVSEIGLLTPAEELICAEKASHGDEDAINELIRKNLRFVITVAKTYVSQTNSIEDLVNEGNIGLMLAARKFKPAMGYKFISYAVWWIQKLILEHLAKHGRIVRLPANKINSISKLDKKISSLEQSLCRTADISEIIESFGADMNKEDIALLETISIFGVDSLDKEISYGGSGGVTTLGDLIEDDNFKNSDHLLIDKDIKTQVVTILKTLKPRDRRIIEALFGMDGREPMTLKEVGDEVGITREMVRQIKEKTLINLKNRLRNSTIRSCQ